MAIVAIIPARYASTRFPGKSLSDIHGKPMVCHVYERARAARSVDRVIVATDDERIAAAAAAVGAEAVMTSPRHASGTDRVAEAARTVDAEIIVNVQGDEPMLDPSDIDAAVAPLLADATADIGTLARPITEVEEMLSPSVVKVVTDRAGHALYFSRSPVPLVRGDGQTDLRQAAQAAVAQGLARKHVGLYAFRRGALERFASLPQSPLERAEALEQLRALENGMRVAVAAAGSGESLAVDTPQDLERVRALMAERPRSWGRS